MRCFGDPIVKIVSDAVHQDTTHTGETNVHCARTDCGLRCDKFNHAFQFF